MKKTGFTLAELLITLVVIGIISAITLPAINKLMPDENKINCIKAYDTLSALVKNLASNTKIYPVCKNPKQNDNQNCSEYPLFNTNQPQLLTAFNDVKYSGDKKLCNLLASFMNVKDASCEEKVYSFSAANFNTQFNNNKSFITANGMQWYVVPAVASAYADGIGTFQTDVYVDVNGNKAPNCIYNADSCKKPDRFKFMVAADGSVQAADPLSRGYINSRRNFNRGELDIAGEGAFLAGVSNRDFSISQCREAADDSPLGCNNSDGLPESVFTIGAMELFNHSFSTYVPNPVKVEVLVYSLKNPELQGLYDETMCVPTALGSTVSSNPMITYDFTLTSDGITNISPYSYGQGYDLNSICQRGSLFLFDKVDVYMTINGLRKKDCNTDGINFYTWELY